MVNKIKQHYRFGMVENCWKVDCAQSVVCLLGIFPRSKFGLVVEIEGVSENALRVHRCSLWDQWRFKILVWVSKPLHCPAQALFTLWWVFIDVLMGKDPLRLSLTRVFPQISNRLKILQRFLKLRFTWPIICYQDKNEWEWYFEKSSNGKTNVIERYVKVLPKRMYRIENIFADIFIIYSAS